MAGQRIAQLSRPDGDVRYTFQAGQAGSIPVIRSPVMSQDIEDTANPRQGRGVFFGQPDGFPVAW